ncbi:hypothetical protein ES288_A05G057100v1 [Gossypium darwinii]|uniref:Phospholipid/glycerol acyltransferase domain-containing protein n=1 Tax=Gossypium darwinii TaxID=34276 RepID=A0A5D2GBR4_GOSDA|nr:hypothetical protein ES288_A05G057100v1 [Gossypium darwinii]
MELSSLHSLSPLPLCYPKPSSSSTLSFLPFSDRTRAYFGYSVRKRATLRNSCNSAQKNFLHISRAHDHEPRCYFSPNEGLNRYCISKLYNLNKLSRYVVAKSELAGAGTPDASYSLSEVKLSSKVRGVCFYAVTAIAAISLIGFMIVAHPFVLLFDHYRRKAQHFVAKLWAAATVAPFFKIEYEGLENLPSHDAPAVYVFQPPEFSRYLYTCNSWKKLQVHQQDCHISFSHYWVGHVYDGDYSIKAHGQQKPVEGTRSKDGKLGDFKKGAFSVAAKTRVPVVPITLIGTGGIMPAGMEGVVNSGSVKVIIHKPIKETDPEILRQIARNTILDTLKLRG